MTETSQLKTKTLFGLFWSFIDLFASQGIQFLMIMILARILSPDHFGLIGMIVVFIVISNSLIDSGLTQALIREKNVNQQDYSTVFFFNLFISCLLYILLYFCAPFISSFFHNEQLVGLLRVSSLGLIISSFGIVQRVILTKKINFRTQTKINVVALICGGILATILAILGFGVWSLVYQTLTVQVIQVILLWFNNKWIPSLTFSMNSFKRLFHFGYKLLISGILDTAFNNVFSIIIGRLYSASQLGLYTNAVKLRDVMIVSVTSALQRVTYPVMSRIQDDEERLRVAFQKIIRTSAFVMFPIMIGLISISDSLIPLLLGQKWIESVIYFKLLCLAGMIYPIHAINLNILQVKGRSDLFLKLEIIKKVLLTLLIGASLFFSFGIIGLIVAAVISSYLSLFINAYYSATEIGYSSLQQLKDMLPSFLIAFLMGGIVYALGSILPDNKFIKLIIQISIGSILYIVFSWKLKIKELETMYQIIVQFYWKMKQGVVKMRGRQV